MISWPTTAKEESLDRITQAVFEVVKEFAQHPYLINCGDCEDFADKLIARLGGERDGLQKLWGDEEQNFFTKQHDPEAHCYILCDGRYYDAEEPIGVTSPNLLPLYQRQLNIAPPII